jgi:hypothetical protein
VLYALSVAFITTSSDGGVTWQPPNFGFTSNHIVASPTNANQVIAIDFSGHVSTSSNGGATYHQIGQAGTGPGTPSASPDGSIYVPISTQFNDPGGILKSTDGGVTWNLLAGSPGITNLNNPPVSVCTANPAVLYFSDGTFLYRSGNAGVTWTKLIPVTNAVVAPSNCQVVYALDTLGLQVSTDGGTTWPPASGDVNITQSYTAIAVDPQNPAHAWAVPGLVAGGAADGFVARIGSDGTTLPFSTFYGGSYYEDVRGTVVDASGNIWIAGSTGSPDLPVTTGVPLPAGPFQGPLFLAEFSDATPACAWHLAPQSAIPNATAGIVYFSVTAPGNCAWTATASDTWISTARTPGGAGSGSVDALISANNGSVVRTGTITVGDQTFTITQPPVSCQYSVDSSTFVVPSAGGQVTVNVTAGSECPWAVIPDGLAIVSGGGGGTGNGSVTFSIPANRGMRAVSFTPRVGPRTVTITVAENCTYSLSPLTSDGGTTNVPIMITASAPACQWSASVDAAWIAIGGYPTGTGSRLLYFGPSINWTGAPRTAHIGIGSQVFTFTQTALALTPTGVLRDTAGAIRLSAYPSPALSSSGGVFASDAAATQDVHGNTVIAARDTYSALWANSYNAGTATWAGWHFGGGAIQGVPAVAVAVDSSGWTWIATRDTWNSYWLVNANTGSGGGFGAWIHLNGVFSTDPVVTACDDGSIYVIGKDNWNALWSGQYIGGSFHGWVAGGGVVNGKPSATCGSDNAVYIAAEDPWNSNWVARVKGNTWTGWYNGGATTSVPPRIASLWNGSEAVVILDQWNAVWTATFTEGTGNGWHSWTKLGGVLSDVSPAAVNGDLYLFGKAPGGDLWWWQQTGNQWTWIGNNGVAAGAVVATPR